MIKQRVIIIREKNSPSILRPSGLGGSSACNHHDRKNTILQDSVPKVPKQGSCFPPLCLKQHPYDEKIGLREIHADIGS